MGAYRTFSNYSSSLTMAASSPSTWQLPPTSASPALLKQISNLSSSIPDPPLYASAQPTRGTKKTVSSTSTSSTAASSKQSLTALRQQKAWDLAIAPAKTVPMQGFMVYMSGGGVQIFSLMIVGQLIKNAISSMLSVNKTFEPLEQSQAATDDGGSVTATVAGQGNKNDFTLQKVVHCLAQGLLLALGLYKCHSMGLLPTHDSDWLAFRKQKIPLEVSDVSLG